MGIFLTGVTFSGVSDMVLRVCALKTLCFAPVRLEIKCSLRYAQEFVDLICVELCCRRFIRVALVFGANFRLRQMCGGDARL